MRARRRSGVLFTVLVTVAMVIGAVIVSALLLASHAPTAIAVGALLAAVPVGPVLGAYVWLDRYEPEPRGLLLMGLGWGALVATSSALVLQLLGKVAFHTGDGVLGSTLAPVTEEGAKGLFILLLFWFRRREFDGILDGIVYAGMVGVGFAFTENILYLSGAYLGENGPAGGVHGAVTLFVVRGVFGPFAHPLFTAFTGIGLGIAVESRSHVMRLLAPIAGYCCAVVAHASWNGAVFFLGARGFVYTYLFAMVPAFMLMVGFAVWARRREGRMMTRALADCAQRGFLDPAEIPWLVRLPARRMARRHARAAGGRAAYDAMRSYQQDATELAFLHDRFLRGTAPRDFAQQGQAYLDAMRVLSPSLVWPGSAGRTSP